MTNGVLWSDQIDPEPARASLNGDREVDIAIVGGGYTGLWTAYSLLIADPARRVLVIDANRVGDGASGRNGGWCVGELAGGLGTWGTAMTRAIMDTVDEVGRVVADERIECGFVKGGVIRVARTGPQSTRQRAEVDEYHHLGFGPDDIQLLDPDEARSELAATNVLGGLRYVHGARVHPARLVHGLAKAVERLGGEIVEHTSVTEIVPAAAPTARAAVETDRGRVTCGVAVRAVEGFAGSLAGHRRTMLPFSSSMIATEPLPSDVWGAIGLDRCQTFSDDRRMVIYGQRTPDDRIAFGGRGAPYRYGSRIDRSRHDVAQPIHDRIEATLHELLPATRDATITHRWGGVLGIPRDWRPSVGFDRATRIAWAGGYVGEGVAAANLAGRTLADLILGNDSRLTSLPWVNHRSRPWEPEPLRWLGVTSMLALTSQADEVETRSGTPSRVGALADRLRTRPAQR